jgi:hypothetical protein
VNGPLAEPAARYVSRGGSPVAPGNGNVPLPTSGAANEELAIKTNRDDARTNADTKDFMSFSYVTESKNDLRVPVLAPVTKLDFDRFYSFVRQVSSELSPIFDGHLPQDITL